MCFIDSPISRCEAVREMVLTDQTQAECAREHECPPGRHCPLDGCFAEMSGVTESAVIAEVAAAEAAHHGIHKEALPSWPTEPLEPVKSSFSAGPEQAPARLAA